MDTPSSGELRGVATGNYNTPPEIRCGRRTFDSLKNRDEDEIKSHQMFMWHLQTHFLLWNLLFVHSNFAHIWSQWSKQQKVNIGWDNGLALKRRQVSVWTNNGLVSWPLCGPFDLDELIADWVMNDARNYYSTFQSIIYITFGNYIFMYCMFIPSNITVRQFKY